MNIIKTTTVEKVEIIIRKVHYALGLFSIALAVACFYDVFYKKVPILDYDEFEPLVPTIMLPFLLGLIQTGILSIGKEDSLFRAEDGKSPKILLGLVRLFLIALFQLLFVHISSLFGMRKGYERRSAISPLHLVFAILLMIIAVVTTGFAEYLVNRRDKSDDARGKKRPFSLKECVLMIGLYVGTVILYGVNLAIVQ